MKPCIINIQEMDCDAIDEFIELSRIEYEDQESVTNYSHIKWKHLDSPYGPSVNIGLYDNTKIVGRVTLQPRQILIGKNNVRMAFATDSLVHPDYRKPLSNFFSIMKEIDHLDDFCIVLHTANENTEQIYHKILKYDCPMTLSGYGVPVNLCHFFKKILRIPVFLSQIINIPYRISTKIICEIISFFSPLQISKEIPDESIFSSFIQNNHEHEDGRYEFKRELSYLKWRFNDAPIWKSTIYYIYNKNKLLGYFVLRNLELNETKFGVIMDFMFDKNINSMYLLFIKSYFISESFRCGNDAVFTLINKRSNDSKKIIGFPLIRIPDRFLPHKTPIFIHINDHNYNFLKVRDDLHITLADLDYF